MSPAYAWVPRLGAEIAVVQFHTTGTAQPPFSGQDHTVYAAMPIVRATLVGRLTSRIGVTADVFGGVSLPRPFVTFGERRVAVWGRPLIGAGIGMQLEID